MDVTTLKSNLESKFELICFYDLADAMISHGEIFKILKKHYRSEYSPNQRLVFYTAELPLQLVLDHLQRSAVAVDISNFFIIVCTPYDIKTLLDVANKKHGNNDIPIQQYFCPLQLTKHISYDKIYSADTFCSLPFGMLTADFNTGTVMPCCKYSSNIGSLKNNTLVELFHSDKINQLRNDIKHGKKHENCKICWDVEACGGTSMRDHFNHKYRQHCDQEWIDNIAIRDLTITPTILCNFKCRICSSSSSSRIASEELKFSTDPINRKLLKKIVNNSTQKNTRTSEQIVEIASNLKFLHILGGEPFLWSELDSLLDELISTGLAKNIQIEFNTNGSVFSDNIVIKLLKFKSVEILISIDDIGDRFEIQRGGEWDKILQNILLFNQLKSPTFSVKLGLTVNIQNVLYLDQLVDFCSDNNLDIVWCFLEKPHYLCIDFVTSNTKDIVFKKYINHPNPELQAIAKRMQLSAPVDGTLFLRYMKELDRRREQDSSVILKEIFDAMSG